MSRQTSAPCWTLYPAYCFRASATYDAWVKLTAADVHALRREQDYPEQHLYFHLNHPIRYVRLVGVVVAIDDINAKYTVVTIDDGSGANMELKIVRITRSNRDATLASSSTTTTTTTTTTTLQNVAVINQCGIVQVMVDSQPLDIGTVVKAKGTVAEFRGVKQLHLQRIWLLPTTDDEAQAWLDTAAFKHNVLSIPWHLTSAQHKHIKAKIQSDKKRLREYERHKVDHEAKKEEQRQAREAYTAQRAKTLERRRRKEEVVMNAGALI
ncbi:hypothetical protein ACEQ8H_008828 [Pleosporales sp. CAS-2024a]